MIQSLNNYHQILKTENLNAAPTKSLFFLESVNILGHQIKNNHIYPLKSKIGGYLKLQSQEKEIKNFVGFFSFISDISTICHYFYDPSMYISYESFSNVHRNYKRFSTKYKNKITDGTLCLNIPKSEKPFYILCYASI